MGLLAGCRGRMVLAYRYLSDVSPPDVALLFTILTVLLYHARYWYTSGPLIALSLAALTWPGLRARPFPWLLTVVLLSTGVARHWYTIDNHQYLLVYWCLSVLLAGGGSVIARILD